MTVGFVTRQTLTRATYQCGWVGCTEMAFTEPSHSEPDPPDGWFEVDEDYWVCPEHAEHAPVLATALNAVHALLGQRDRSWKRAVEDTKADLRDFAATSPFTAEDFANGEVASVLEAKLSESDG